ncbi:MAG: alpha/beta fold hydrolase [Pirellula sp.]
MPQSTNIPSQALVARFPRSRGVPEWAELFDNHFTPYLEQDFERLGTSGRIHEEFDRIAHRFPESIAVVGSASVTYRELIERSWQAATALEKRGVRPGDILCIVARNDWLNIAAMLGGMRLGCTCCMVAPHEPPKSVAERFESQPIRAPFFVVEQDASDWLNTYQAIRSEGVDTGVADELSDDRAAILDSIFEGEPCIGSRDVRQFEQTGSAPAFVFFTSGSTGTPQGVAMSHEFILLDIARQINDLAVRPSDRVDLLFSPNFSAFLAPTFRSLLSGASCWVRSLYPSIPADLPSWLEDSGITISTMSVSVMRGVFRQFPVGVNWPSLRILSVGSEPLLASDVALFHEKCGPKAFLQNAMAATETRTYAQYFLGRGSFVKDPLPIGFPVLGRDIQLIDEHERVVETGQIGQITISSKRLAEGYWPIVGEPSFPFRKLDGGIEYHSSDLGYLDSDGILYFVGRKDSMVKIRGQKVFLNQIESELQRIPGVVSSFVHKLDRNAASPQIVAWVESKLPMTTPEVRSLLMQRLSAISMPSMIQIVDEFPRTATGKIDRQKLIQSAAIESENAPSDFVTYGTLKDGDPVLKSILKALRSIAFTKSVISPETLLDSLEIDSIRALELSVIASRDFGKRITYENIQYCGTVGDLADLIRRAPTESILRNLVSAPIGAPRLVLFPSIAADSHSFDSLVQQLIGQVAAGTEFGVSIGENNRLKLPTDAPCTIANFADLLIEELASIPSSAPLVLAGHSWGGFIAYELATKLEFRGRAAEHLMLIDTVYRKGIPRNPIALWRRRISNFPAWLQEDACQMSAEDWRRESLKKIRRSLNWFGNDARAPQGSVYDQQYRAACAYTPREYSGKTTLIRARAQSLTRPVFGALGWETVLRSPPKVRVIPGNHLSILNARNSAFVTEVILSVLESVRTDEPLS